MASHHKLHSLKFERGMKSATPRDHSTLQKRMKVPQVNLKLRHPNLDLSMRSQVVCSKDLQASGVHEHIYNPCTLYTLMIRLRTYYPTALKECQITIGL
jgi:hypothetical protein